MTETAEMRRLLVLMEQKNTEPQEQPLEEWRGWKGSLSGYMQGARDRRELFRDWKRFRRRYRRSGTLADLQDWLRLTSRKIPPEQMNAALRKSGVSTTLEGDTPIEDSKLSKFFSELAFLDRIGDTGRPESPNRDEEPTRRAASAGRGEAPSQAAAAGQPPPLDKLDVGKLKAAIINVVEPEHRNRLLQWVEQIPQTSS